MEEVEVVVEVAKEVVVLVSRAQAVVGSPLQHPQKVAIRARSAGSNFAVEIVVEKVVKLVDQRV